MCYILFQLPFTVQFTTKLYLSISSIYIYLFLLYIHIINAVVDEAKEWDNINPIVDYITVKEPVAILSPVNRLQTCENDFKKNAFHLRQNFKNLGPNTTTHNHQSYISDTDDELTQEEKTLLEKAHKDNKFFGRFAQEFISCDDMEKRFFEFAQQIFYEQRVGKFRLLSAYYCLLLTPIG